MSARSTVLRNLSEAPGSATLASEDLPGRVRRILAGLLEYCADEVERGITATLNDFEQELFKLAEQSHEASRQEAHFDTRRMLIRNRADLLPRYLIALEDALATLRCPRTPALPPPHAAAEAGGLTLVDTDEIDKDTVLREIGTRAESRAGLHVYLLGQRFGVLAGRPAYDAETLPIGPHRICRMLYDTSACLGIDEASRLLLLRVFERRALMTYPGFAEAANSWLSAQGVLPTLRFVPVRVHPVRQARSATAARPAAVARAPEKGGGGAVADAPRGGEWSAMPEANATFDVLRQLLAGRRELIGKFAQGAGAPAAAATPGHGQPSPLPGAAGGHAPASAPIPTEILQAALATLQRRVPGQDETGPATTAPNVARIKQAMLERIRADGAPASALAGEDDDAIDLVGLLFEQLMKDVRPNSPAAALLGKLQVPLMRVALRDKSVFTTRSHPARKILSSVAETGMYWLGENEDDADHQLGERLHLLVDRAVQEYDDGDRLFEALAEDLDGHLQTVARKAELAERRHVDAARGKEKLALSRTRATEAVDAVLHERRVPHFVRSLLRQAWTDVLTLAALRGGDGSEWARQLDIAHRVAAAADARADPGAGDPPASASLAELRTQVGQALAQVGYHEQEAQAIARRLTRRGEDLPEEDTASRTELAMKLKARARLGEDHLVAAPGQTVALDERERACLARLRALPFGTWFEFTVNQQGDRARRRLAWFSTVTGNALFVNHRGQRVAEHDMEWLARAMAKDQVRALPANGERLVDRAWDAMVGALRSFSGHAPAPAAP